MATTAPASVLVYDRIAQNHRKTVLLVVVTIVAIVPFIAALSYGAADLIVQNFAPHRHMSQAQEESMRKAFEPRPGATHYQFQDQIRAEIDRQFDKERAAREEEEAANNRFRWQAMIVVAIALTGVMALLFWSLASSPTSRILAMCGARPAGSSEDEVRRILENLSIGAGLPPPRLYVVDSPAPNAFAAGLRTDSSAVAVTSGLIALLDRRELEGVLAHELSHIGNQDTRLNTFVGAIALFLRLPALLRRRGLDSRKAGYHYRPPRRGFRVRFSLVLLPLYIYVCFIAPVIAAVLRSMVSRTREYLADADAALLTRYPEGLMRALAKIRGSGSMVPGSNPALSHLYFADAAVTGSRIRLFTGNLFATHPPIEDRIQRLVEFNGGLLSAVLEDAVRAGQDFGRDHPPVPSTGLTDTAMQDELGALTAGNPMGRVCRVLSATRVYDQPDRKSPVLAQVLAGQLVVVFDDPGPFRQILTHDDIFGYVPGTVKVKRADMLPAEIHDPAARARIESIPIDTPEPGKGGRLGLTGAQIAMAAGFGIFVFAGIILLMILVGR